MRDTIINLETVNPIEFFGVNNGKLDKQTYSHQEGQQNNIAGSDGSSNSNAEGSNEQTSGLRREAGVAQGGQQSQTESDRANENEDEGVRGGNSSI